MIENIYDPLVVGSTAVIWTSNDTLIQRIKVYNVSSPIQITNSSPIILNPNCTLVTNVTFCGCGADQLNEGTDNCPTSVTVEEIYPNFIGTKKYIKIGWSGVSGIDDGSGWTMLGNSEWYGSNSYGGGNNG